MRTRFHLNSNIYESELFVGPYTWLKFSNRNGKLINKEVWWKGLSEDLLNNAATPFVDGL